MSAKTATGLMTDAEAEAIFDRFHAPSPIKFDAQDMEYIRAIEQEARRRAIEECARECEEGCYPGDCGHYIIARAAAIRALSDKPSQAADDFLMAGHAKFER